MKISIITVNRNNLNGLRQTVESVLNQSAPRDQFEYIVVDGASTDGGASYLASRGQDFDKWVSEKDGGIYEAMNKGVSYASGDYCLFLNSGDVLHDNNVLEEVLSELDTTDIIIGSMLISNTGESWHPHDEVSLLSLYKGSLPHNASFISRRLLQQYPYDEKLRISSDWKFWVEVLVLKGVSYKYIDRVVTDYDCTGISSRNRVQSQMERRIALSELIPERILCDYTRFFDGGGYQTTPYDRFYIGIRETKYGRWLFKINTFILRCAAVFFPSARFIRSFSRYHD